jgi:hypothetical protein
MQLTDFGKSCRIQLFQLDGSDHEINVYGPFFNTSLPGGLSEWEPPDPIPNSEVKLLSADDSVGLPHVKVGHCQAFIRKPRYRKMPGFFYFSDILIV